MRWITNARDITLWFLSSVSSVEVSVLGLASAIVDSPQFSRWPPDVETRRPPDVETRIDCGSFCSDNAWDPTIATDRLVSEDASD